MKRVIIVGSPRSAGRSAHVAEMLFEAHIDERPEDELFLVPVSEIDVGPCIGCNACRELTEVVIADDIGAGVGGGKGAGAGGASKGVGAGGAGVGVGKGAGDAGGDSERGERVELRPRCVFDDDMQTLYDLLDDADELTIVSPVYFSGAPGVLKCLLDRLQPYFWANTRKAPKRPATLHVLGEGGDPHGFSPLVSEVKSSIACAGFRLERVYDWVGKVDERDEIVAEADVVEIASASGTAPAAQAQPATHDRCATEVAELGEARQPNGDGKASRAVKERPKLDLSHGGKAARGGGPGQSGGKAARAKGQAHRTGSQKKGKRCG